jgi:hypothetical protein
MMKYVGYPSHFSSSAQLRRTDPFLSELCWGVTEQRMDQRSEIQRHHMQSIYSDLAAC